MRATEALQKCLGDTLNTMYALSSRVLSRAVEALVTGCGLTPMEQAHGLVQNGHASP